LLPQSGCYAQRLACYRVEWPGDPGVEFHLSHGDWIRLLRGSGFDIEELVEVRPPADATTRYPLVTLEWARQWPCEEVWKCASAPPDNHYRKER